MGAPIPPIRLAILSRTRGLNIACLRLGNHTASVPQTLATHGLLATTWNNLVDSLAGTVLGARQSRSMVRVLVRTLTTLLRARMAARRLRTWSLRRCARTICPRTLTLSATPCLTPWRGPSLKGGATSTPCHLSPKYDDTPHGAGTPTETHTQTRIVKRTRTRRNPHARVAEAVAIVTPLTWKITEHRPTLELEHEFRKNIPQ